MKIENGIIIDGVLYEKCPGEDGNIIHKKIGEIADIQIVKPHTVNGHEFVDLGLSVKWATCNIGASTPSDYGDYYAWGETSAKTSYTRRNSATYGKNMGNIAGDFRYDAARANWGGSWRLPTKVEIDELVSKCEREWTTMDGYNGFKVIGPSGKPIFLPTTGYCYGKRRYHAGIDGGYWSATPDEGDPLYAYVLSFFLGDFFSRAPTLRNNGHSVRPVTE